MILGNVKSSFLNLMASYSEHSVESEKRYSQRKIALKNPVSASVTQYFKLQKGFMLSTKGITLRRKGLYWQSALGPNTSNVRNIFLWICQRNKNIKSIWSGWIAHNTLYVFLLHMGKRVWSYWREIEGLWF